jgi:hypothetical protein
MSWLPVLFFIVWQTVGAVWVLRDTKRKGLLSFADLLWPVWLFAGIGLTQWIYVTKG